MLSRRRRTGSYSVYKCSNRIEKVNFTLLHTICQWTKCKSEQIWKVEPEQMLASNRFLSQSTVWNKNQLLCHFIYLFIFRFLGLFQIPLLLSTRSIPKPIHVLQQMLKIIPSCAFLLAFNCHFAFSNPISQWCVLSKRPAQYTESRKPCRYKI